MNITRPSRIVAVFLLLWLTSTLTNRGWIGNIPGLRTLAGNLLIEFPLFLLLIIVWLVLLVRNLLAWRHKPLRAQVHANLLCLALAALLAFALPSKAVTMFYLWHDDFQRIAHNQAYPGMPFKEHWKYGTVKTNLALNGGVTVQFDYGVGVAGLLYNPHDEPIKHEIMVFCDPDHDEGGFIRRLETNWFLCYRMYY